MRAHQVRSYGPGVNTDDRPTPLTGEAPTVGRPQYEIRVGGRLGAHWAASFEGFDLTTEDDGTTVLRGSVTDQAALHGLLHRLRDIGIPLVSLGPIPAGPSTDLPDLHADPTRHNPPGATT
jgi:hypothetical protein